MLQVQHFTSDFLKFKSNCLVIVFFFFLNVAFHSNPGFNFTRTSCIICYHTNQIVKIFQILHLFFYNLHWGWLSLDCYYLSIYFPYSFPFHSSFHFQLQYQSYRVALFLVGLYLKVIYIFNSVNCLPLLKPFKSFFGTAFAAYVEDTVKRKCIMNKIIHFSTTYLLKHRLHISTQH